MAVIKDLRLITPRSNGTRPLSAIKNIARHHSATTDGSWASFWRHWNGTLKWGTGGYHELILRDGTVELCYDPTEITNGVGGQNSYIYNICVVGNGSFTAEQERVFDERARYWLARFNLPASAVKGHKEFPGQNTACPGVNMNEVRARLIGAKYEPVSAPKTISIPKPLVKAAVFPLKTESIVDWLNANKQNSSVANRKALAKLHGIRDYTGAADQNVALLRMLQSATDKPAKVTTTPSLAVDGYFGPATVRALQRYFGTPVDGVISRPSSVIMALQRLLGVKADGLFGPITIKALQRRFGTTQDGVISQPSLVIRELQRRLNIGKL